MIKPRINGFKEAIVATLKEKIPLLRECRAQFGRFNLDELEKESIRTPAITVGLLNGKASAQPSGHSEITFSCAAFIVTDGKTREDDAWNLAEAVIKILHSGQMFGLTKLNVPASVVVQPVISASIRTKGVAILAVEWSQILREIGENVFDENGHVITELYINGEAIEVLP